MGAVGIVVEFSYFRALSVRFEGHVKTEGHDV